MQPERWPTFVRKKTGMAHLKLKLEDSETKDLDFQVIPNDSPVTITVK